MMFCEAHEKRKKTKKEFKKQSCKNMTKETFCAKKITQKGKCQKMSFFCRQENTGKRFSFFSKNYRERKIPKEKRTKKRPKKNKRHPKRKKCKKKLKNQKLV